MSENFEIHTLRDLYDALASIGRHHNLRKMNLGDPHVLRLIYTDEYGSAYCQLEVADNA